MQLTPIITFRGVERTPALEAEIAARLHKLETYHRSIMGCRVLIELVQRHREAGNHYHVRIDLTVPGEELVVTHDASSHATAKDIAQEVTTKAGDLDAAHKHARVAIHEAFDVARRQLQDFARRQRGAVKKPATQARGRVSQLFPIDEYGYIQADDTHEVYFHKRSVLKGAFDRLSVGTAVSFVEEPGEKGPQASTVKLLHPRRTRRAGHTPAVASVVRP